MLDLQNMEFGHFIEAMEFGQNIEIRREQRRAVTCPSGRGGQQRGMQAEGRDAGGSDGCRRKGRGTPERGDKSLDGRVLRVKDHDPVPEQQTFEMLNLEDEHRPVGYHACMRIGVRKYAEMPRLQPKELDYFTVRDLAGVALGRAVVAGHSSTGHRAEQHAATAGPCKHHRLHASLWEAPTSYSLTVSLLDISMTGVAFRSRCDVPLPFPATDPPDVTMQE